MTVLLFRMKLHQERYVFVYCEWWVDGTFGGINHVLLVNILRRPRCGLWSWSMCLQLKKLRGLESTM